MDSDLHSHLRLRWRVYQRLCNEWGAAPIGHCSEALWKLLGRSSIVPDDRNGCYFTPRDLCTDAELTIIHTLLSDNGYTVYRMLLARMEQPCLK